MRRTAKYIEGLKTCRELHLKVGELAYPDYEGVYAALEAAVYHWDAGQQLWIKGAPPSTSMFETDDGLGTGIFRLRLMAHPADVERVVQAVAEGLKPFAVIDDISNPYPNRRGPGVRVYFTCKLLNKTGRGRFR